MDIPTLSSDVKYWGAASYSEGEREVFFGKYSAARQQIEYGKRMGSRSWRRDELIRVEVRRLRRETGDITVCIVGALTAVSLVN
jgi:hypothetical protein